MADKTFQDSVLSVVKKWVFENIHTCLPAVVIDTSEFQSSQMVTVQPVLNRVDEDAVIVELPSIKGPVVFPSAGGGLLSFPIKVGNTVEVRFSMFSLSEWLSSNGSTQTPSDRRKYSYNDAIITPCLYTTQSNLHPNPNDFEIKFKGASIKILDSGEITVDAGNTPNITITGENITVNATTVDVNADEVNLGESGAGIARLGDSVEVTVMSGSSSGTWSGTITSASSNNTSA